MRNDKAVIVLALLAGLLIFGNIGSIHQASADDATPTVELASPEPTIVVPTVEPPTVAPPVIRQEHTPLPPTPPPPSTRTAPRATVLPTAVPRPTAVAVPPTVPPD